MGEIASPQKMQLEEMVLKDGDDGKDMETDGLLAGLLQLLLSFPFFSPRPAFAICT